jgi:outer membrane protein OmpA-like peptidoglycan-associated protein
MPRITIAVALLLAAPSLAAADPTEIGAWFGPRLYSRHSVLGYINDAPAHPMLQNAVEFGARVSHQFIFPWFFPELEIAVAPTSTNAVGGADAVNVFWLEPRVQLRFELLPGRRVQPFLIVGGGTPVAFSSARKTFNSGIVGDGYAGGGVRFDTHKGFNLRLDARLAILPGVNPMTGDNRVAFEGDIGIGFEIVLGAKHAPKAEVKVAAPPADRDGDGIADATDKCPDRPEDKDGFEDADGCPDIDNDGDLVLDIADKCPQEQELYNGFQDDDGCPDTVPDEVTGLAGTIEGLLYADGETAVRASAQPALQKIAKVLKANPSVRLVLVGHTDGQEAKAFATPPAAGQPPPDVDAIATQLAHARAEAVRQALVALGIPEGRMVVQGVGAAEPVADDATPKGRLANRRVEVKLFVAR